MSSYCIPIYSREYKFASTGLHRPISLSPEKRPNQFIISHIRFFAKPQLHTKRPFYHFLGCRFEPWCANWSNSSGQPIKRSPLRAPFQNTCLQPYHIVSAAAVPSKYIRRSGILKNISNVMPKGEARGLARFSETSVANRRAASIGDFLEFI